MFGKKNNDTPYSLLKTSRDSIKAVEVITDHQAVFRSHGGIYYSHYGIISSIEKEIYPSLLEMEIEERQQSNTYIFMSDYDAIVELPSDGNVSMAQLYFVLDFIKEVSKYNREVSSNQKIPIVIDWYKKVKIFDILDINDKIVKEWKKHLRDPQKLSDEKIVGVLYSEKEKNSIFKR